MLAVRLVIHALQQILGDPRAILLLALPNLVWGVVLQAGAYWQLGRYGIDGAASDQLLPQLLARLDHDVSRLLMLGGIVNAVLYLLMAVSWHRHILLAEPPRLFRRGRVRQIVQYTLMALSIIGIPSVLFLISVGLPLFGAKRILADTGLNGRGTVLPTMTIFLLQILALFPLSRLTTALQGVALRQDRALARAWCATRGHAATFAALAVAGGVVQSMLPFVGLLLAASPANPILPAGLVASLLSWLAGLSLMTTLWGLLVEGRPLR